MEYQTIEREIHIEATPEVVFDVVSRPEHIRQWWSNDAQLDVVTGAEGTLTWTDKATNEAATVAITVVEVDRPHLFSFRWVYPDGQTPREGNSILVEFALERAGDGTRLRMTESGLGEIGWDEAGKATYAEQHGTGWDHHLPALREYARAYAQTATLR